MSVKLTLRFKDGSERTFETHPLGIDGAAREYNAVTEVLSKLSPQEREQVEDYKSEDDFL